MSNSELQIEHTGNRSWWSDGQLHKKDGPAIERPDGVKSWWIEDKKHRIDGPAIEDADGTKKWFLRGIELDPIEHFLEVQRMRHHET